MPAGQCSGVEQADVQSRDPDLAGASPGCARLKPFDQRVQRGVSVLAVAPEVAEVADDGVADIALPGLGDVGRDPRWRGIADHQHRRRQHGKGGAGPGQSEPVDPLAVAFGARDDCDDGRVDRLSKNQPPSRQVAVAEPQVGARLTSGLNRAASTWSVHPPSVAICSIPARASTMTRCGWAVLPSYNVPREGIGGLYSAPISKASANPSASVGARLCDCVMMDRFDLAIRPTGAGP